MKVVFWNPWYAIAAYCKALTYFFSHQRNAADLERKRIEELKAEGRYVGPSKPMDHEKAFFPKYDEYELLPGEDKFEREKRWDEFKNPYFTPEEDTVTKKTKDSKWFYGDTYSYY